MHAPSKRPLATEMSAWKHRSPARPFDSLAIASAADESFVRRCLNITHDVAPMVEDAIAIAILGICIASARSAEACPSGATCLCLDGLKMFVVIKRCETSLSL